MNESVNPELELQLIAAGRSLPYPPTPDLVGPVMQQLGAMPSRRRRKASPAKKSIKAGWVYAVAVVLVLLAGLLAVPSVRAQILEFIQIGVVRIFTGSPAPTEIPAPSQQPAVEPPINPTGVESPVTGIPQGSQMPVVSLLEIDGATTLEQAARDAEFDVRLPEYPPDLGTPDRVFFQEFSGQMLVMVWTDPNDPEAIRLSLHQYSGEDGINLSKNLVRRVEETSVNDNWAIWAEGPYYLQLENGEVRLVRLVEGRVLIWEEDGVTYRLETDLPLDEAVRIAESLQRVQ
jgi:hypothetical protein